MGKTDSPCSHHLMAPTVTNLIAQQENSMSSGITPFKRRSQRRCGSAAVEAAVCFPVIFLIIIASIEVCGGMFQNYDAHAAAFELTKKALVRTTTSDDLQAEAATLLPQLGFDTYSVRIDVLDRTVNADSVEPTSHSTFLIPQTGVATPGFEELPRGTVLRLTLTVDRPAVPGRGMIRKYLDGEIHSDCVFVKEF